MALEASSTDIGARLKLLIANGEFDITDQMITAWKANFAGIDIDAELAQMHLWLAKNPSRRPNVYPLRFVERWLKKCKPKKSHMHIVQGRMSEHDMLTEGRKLGLEPRAGEGWEQFGRRLREKMAAA